MKEPELRGWAWVCDGKKRRIMTGKKELMFACTFLIVEKNQQTKRSCFISFKRRIRGLLQRWKLIFSYLSVPAPPSSPLFAYTLPYFVCSLSAWVPLLTSFSLSLLFSLRRAVYLGAIENDYQTLRNETWFRDSLSDTAAFLKCCAAPPQWPTKLSYVFSYTQVGTQPGNQESEELYELQMHSQSLPPSESGSDTCGPSKMDAYYVTGLMSEWNASATMCLRHRILSYTEVVSVGMFSPLEFVLICLKSMCYNLRTSARQVTHLKWQKIMVKLLKWQCTFC